MKYSGTDTREELSVAKDAFELIFVDTSNQNKFAYFNDNLETVDGGSREDCDDWTLSKNKCKLCRRIFHPSGISNNMHKLTLMEREHTSVYLVREASEERIFEKSRDVTVP